MTRALQIAHLCVLLAVLALLGALGWRAWKVAGELDTVLARIAANSDELNISLQQVNRPCGTKINGLTLPCGTLATINKTVVKVGDAIVTTQEEERAITPHTLTAMDSLNSASLALAGTARAATETLQGASVDLRTLNGSLAQTKPLIDAITATVSHADAILPTLSATATNVNQVTGNLAASTSDFESKFHAYLYPPPCRTTWCKLRRAWPYIHGGAEMAEPGYWAWQLFKGAMP